ncbi:MAG: hypothetical protein JNG84_07965, partial [Archangium sp.]|nr:hypothetical protein [Archangium sp.]
VAANYSAYLDTTVAKIVDVVLKTYDFSKRSTLLDLCGCTGAFVTGVLKAVPTLEGAFIDVPACADIGQAQLAAASPDLQKRMKAIGGDVLATPLPPSDVITICRSAIDFNDEKLVRIYRRAREALKPGGEFLIIERMIPEKETDETRALHMRAVYFLAKSPTTRYRRVPHHFKLLREAGFTRFNVVDSPERPYEFFKDMHIIAASV